MQIACTTNTKQKLPRTHIHESFCVLAINTIFTVETIVITAERVGEIAGRLEVHPNMLGRWKNKAVKEMHTIFEDEKTAANKKYEAEKQELYAQISELSSKLAWLKKIWHRRIIVANDLKCSKALINTRSRSSVSYSD